MPAIPSYKKIVAMLDKITAEGETISSATFQGGLKKCVIATTSQKRLLITTLPFFGSSAKILNSIPFEDISKLDIFPAKSVGFFTVETNDGEKHLWKVPAAGLFDTFGKLVQIYQVILFHNPAAKPSYLGVGEEVVFMVKTSEGVLKATEEKILFLEANKKTGESVLKRSLPISDIDCVDFSIGKLTASYVYLRVDGEEMQLKIGDTLIGIGSAMEAISVKGSAVVAESFYKKIIAQKASAKPDYMDEGEELLATARVGHSRMSVTGGSFLRATDSRIFELTLEKTGRLTVKEEIPLRNIESGKLRTIRGDNTTQYELVIKTAAKKYKFVATDDYAVAMEGICNLINDG